MRSWAPWAAALALVGAGPVHGAPGRLELHVKRAAFGLAVGAPLVIEGVHLHVELPASDDTTGSPLRVDARSSLTGARGGGEAWWRRVSGQARLDAVGGRLPRSRLLRSISTALLRRLPLVPVPAAPKADEHVPIEQASASFELAAGVAHSEDLRIVTRDYVLEGSCRIDAELALELTGTLELTPSGLDAVLSFAGLDLGLGGVVHVPAIPIRAEGPVAGPRFEADVSGLPLAAWALVPRTLGAAVGVAEKGLGGLTGAVREAAGHLRRDGSEGGGEP